MLKKNQLTLKEFFLLVQAVALHKTICNLLPGHALESFSGGGFVQSRICLL